MKEQKHHLITFSTDNAMVERLEGTAVSQNLTVTNIFHEGDVGPSRIVLQREALGEKLSGQIGKLFELITQLQPVLLIFDLDKTAVPWYRWIPTLKTSPATRRFPILSISSSEDQLTEAKRVGANYISTREEFEQNQEALIKKNARIPNYERLASACEEPLSDLAKDGIDLFNQGEFYKCHDALEEAWNIDNSAGRNLYRGILQIGIAYFQIERGNYRGGIKMLMRVRQWLDPLPDTCRGVDIADLRQNAEKVQEALSNLGPDRIAEFDKTLFKPIRLR